VQVLLDVNAKKRFDSNFWRGVLDAQVQRRTREGGGSGEAPLRIGRAARPIC